MTNIVVGVVSRARAEYLLHGTDGPWRIHNLTDSDGAVTDIYFLSAVSGAQRLLHFTLT